VKGWGTAAGMARPRLAIPGLTRRGIQVALGLMWVLDGLLQLQPAMLTSRFTTQVIRPAGVGQPGFVSLPVGYAAQLIGHDPVLFDVGFGMVQLLLGVGLLYPRTVRWAIPASMAWALAVWYLGEGLGGLFGGTATVLTGAPGAALLYALLALAGRPRRDHPGAADPPPRWTAVSWAVLWLGGAVLQALPGADTNASVAVTLAMNASRAPAWFATIEHHLAVWLPGYGVSIIVDLVVLQVLAGLGVFGAGRVRRLAVVLGMALALGYWVVGQDLGQFWSGIATDPDTGPLAVLLGLAVLGSPAWRAGGGGQPAPASSRLRVTAEPATPTPAAETMAAGSASPAD
jgi:hypothetical protein